MSPLFATMASASCAWPFAEVLPASFRPTIVPEPPKMMFEPSWR